MVKLTERQARRAARNEEILKFFLALKESNQLATRHKLASITERNFKDKYDVCVSTIYHIVEDYERKIGTKVA